MQAIIKSFGVACLFAPCLAGAQASNVYVADSEAGAIYARDPASGETRIVSATIGVEAEWVAFLPNGHELLYVPSNNITRVVQLDLGTNALGPAASIGGEIQAICEGSNENEFAVLFLPTGETIYRVQEFRRTGPSGAWTESRSFQTPIQRAVGSYNFGIIKPSADKYVVFRKVGQTVVYEIELVGDVPTATMVESNKDYPTAATVGDSAWVLRSSGGTRLFDADDLPASELALPTSPLFSPTPLFFAFNLPIPFAWAGEGPAVFGVKGDILLTDASPYGDVQVVFSPFNSSGKVDPRYGLGGVATISHDTDKTLLFDEINRRLLSINDDGDAPETRLIHEVGSGPMLHDIRAMTMGSDGLLYLVDEFAGMRSILSVNPANGRRALVAEGLARAEALRRNDDATFSLLSLDDYKTVWTVLTPGATPTEFSIATRAIQDVPNSGVADLRFDSAGNPSALLLGVDATPLVWDGAALARVQNENIAIAPTVENAQFSTRYKVTGAFDLDRDPPIVADSIAIQIDFVLNEPFSFNGTNLVVAEITDGDGSVHPITAGDADFTSTPTGATEATFELLLHLDRPTALSGMWQFRYEFDSRFNMPFTISAARFVPTPSNRSRFMVRTDDPNVVLLETDPPALLKLGIGSRTTERIPIAPPASVSTTARDFACDIAYAPRDNSLYIAFTNNQSVSKYDLATGAAEELIRGRPASFPWQMAGIEAAQDLVIATGPTIPLGATATGWTVE